MKRLTLLCSTIAMLAAIPACARDRTDPAADTVRTSTDSVKVDSVKPADSADTAKPTASSILFRALTPASLEAQSTSVASTTTSAPVAEHHGHGALWWTCLIIVLVLVLGAAIAFVKRNRHKSTSATSSTGDYRRPPSSSI